MLVKVNSIAAWGMDIIGITIEVNVASRGFPSFDIVGLPGKEISESKHRILTALQNCGISLPAKKIVINLAPADVPKVGSYYDLPISVGLICAITCKKIPDNAVFYGELSLDGSLCRMSGAFLAALYASDGYLNKVFIPAVSDFDFSLFENIDMYGLNTLNDFITGLDDGFDAYKIKTLKPHITDAQENPAGSCVSLSDIIGQGKGKRAIEISAAGGHNLMLEGPPGAGKTMLAKSYLSISPKLTEAECVEVSKIYAVKGINDIGGNHVYERPFRSPHHTISYTGMIGGGSIPKPGEISLAHRGVLFLDEFPEFSYNVIESLRQPLEDGTVVVTRNKGTFLFPSNFTLIAAANPCPCGFFEHPSKACVCTPRQIQNYKKRISGPILDRIDLFVFVNPVKLENLTLQNYKNSQQLLDSKAEAEKIKNRVHKARNMQNERYKGQHVMTNSEMTGEHIRKYCTVTKEAQALLQQATVALDLSARSYFRLLKVARTVADLDERGDITEQHVSEAVWYRGV